VSAAPVRDICRGPEPDELEFTLVDGTVLIAHAHGVHRDEQLRTREALMAALGPLTREGGA
jgi:hypothetical protein